MSQASDSIFLVFVLGGPGCGKGTQCSKLVKDFGFVHLSAGDLLRAERDNKSSQYGELINTYMKEGKIVPSEITIDLLKKAIILNDDSDRFLIDGFPRQMDQALQFEKEVSPPNCVLFFDCPEDVMLDRLLKRSETSDRVDDNIESIKKRFKTFVETSYPVIEYYKESGKVYTIPCTEGIDAVYAKVKPIFEDLLKKK